MASLSDCAGQQNLDREQGDGVPTTSLSLSLSLVFSACQKTSETEGELEAPSLPRPPFSNSVPLANVSLSFRRDLVRSEFELDWRRIMEDEGMTEGRAWLE